MHHIRKYAFVAHWVETWNIWLWWSDDLQKNPEHAWRWAVFWPVAFLFSIVYMAGRKVCHVVDRFVVNGRVRGEIVLVDFFAYQFMIPQLHLRRRIQQMVLKAVLVAQELGADVIGLGALCKDESLTRGGEWIVEQLGGRLHVPLIHGDTLTAAADVQRALQLISLFHLEGKPVMLTGATSKIGRAIALDFARRGIEVYMHTKSRERFEYIQNEAGANGCHLIQAESFAVGKDAGLWITGKADKGAGKRLIKWLPEGAVVMNFSVPDPLTPRLLRRRPDVRHFDGGLMGYDPQKTSLHFNMRLKPGMTYACHAGTMVHAMKGWTHHEVGPVDVGQMETVWKAALECGLDLPILTSFLRPVDETGATINPPATRESGWSFKAASW